MHFILFQFVNTLRVIRINSFINEISKNYFQKDFPAYSGRKTCPHYSFVFKNTLILLKYTNLRCMKPDYGKFPVFTNIEIQWEFQKISQLSVSLWLLLFNHNIWRQISKMAIICWLYYYADEIPNKEDYLKKVSFVCLHSSK